MKAIVQDRYGSADVLQLRDVETPRAGDGEVLLRVQAAGVDPGVWHLMTGLPYLVRMMGRPRGRVLGMDVAGKVEAVGPGVKRLRPGDEVFGACRGSFAEYARAKEENLALRPASLAPERAAAVAISGLTALQGLRDAGGLKPGQAVAIVGAAGGVGSFAVQIARALGAEVTGICSTTKLELVRSLGAAHVVDYTREDFTAGQRRYDLVLDTAGNRPLSRLRRALTPHGTLVIVGGEAGGRWLGGVDRQLQALLLSPFLSQRLRPMLAAVRQQDLQVLRQLLAAGQLEPVVDRTYPLAEAAAALRHIEGAKARGKVVLRV